MAVRVVAKLTVVVRVGSSLAEPEPVADSVAAGSRVVVVVVSTSVTDVTVSVTVVDGDGNAGRVRVVVTPSEIVITTDWAMADAAKAARSAKRAIFDSLV